MWLFVGLGWLLSVGCSAKTVEMVDVATMPDEVPTYSEIAGAQNARVGEVEKYWSAIRARLRWYDDVEGKWHEESGEGHLILERPFNVAMTFSKVGKIGFWAGSNAEEYWVFQGGDDAEVFVGRNENAFAPCAEPLPISVHPLELVDLSGLFLFPEIAEDGGGRAPVVSYASKLGAWVVDIPGRWSIRRVYLRVGNLLPVRIELCERFDRDVVYAAADLSSYVRQRITELSEEERPWVPARFVLRQAGVAGGVTLEAVRPADRTGNGPIRPQVFEFRSVARVMKPKREHVLDVNCPKPARNE